MNNKKYDSSYLSKKKIKTTTDVLYVFIPQRDLQIYQHQINLKMTSTFIINFNFK